MWKKIDNDVQVMAVPGGMLVRTWSIIEGSVSEALCLVPCAPPDAEVWIAARIEEGFSDGE